MLSLGAKSGNLITYDTLDGIALPYVGLLIAIYLVSIFYLRRYSLTRSGHEANLQAIGKHNG